jgi:hypothetical protein
MTLRTAAPLAFLALEAASTRIFAGINEKLVGERLCPSP